jgi:hypothetical protein
MIKVNRVLGLAILSSGLLVGTAGVPALAQDCPTTNDNICNEPDIGDATCKAGSDTADCTASDGPTSGGDAEMQAMLMNAGSLYEAFEIALPEAPPGLFTYNTVAPIGENGIEFTDLVVTDDGDEVSMDRLLVNNVDWRAMMAESTPTFMDVVIEGLAIPVGAMDLDPMAASMLGNVVNTDLAISYNIDGTTMTLDQLSLDMEDLASVGLALTANGIDPSAGDPSMMMMGSTIANGELTFQDSGLVALILDQASQATGMDSEQAAAMAVMQLQLMGGSATSPDAQASMQALTSFLQAGSNPEGTLTMSLNPDTPFSPLALMGIADPDTAIQMMGLLITYQ